MGLIAGKSSWAACLAEGLNVTEDGPNTSLSYINFGIPEGMLDSGIDFLDTITHTSGGYSYSDRNGMKKKDVNINKSIIDPQVQATAMAELNAITDFLDEMGDVGADSVYFIAILNSVNKTFRDSSGTSKKYLKCRVRSLRWKPVGPNNIEFSCRLEECE